MNRPIQASGDQVLVVGTDRGTRNIGLMLDREADGLSVSDHPEPCDVSAPGYDLRVVRAESRVRHALSFYGKPSCLSGSGIPDPHPVAPPRKQERSTITEDAVR